MVGNINAAIMQIANQKKLNDETLPSMIKYSAMNKSSKLFEKLISYAQSDIYPFCMPGHKRRNSVMLSQAKEVPVMDPYQLDITEVEGFDDFHHADGILKEITDHAQEVYAKGDVRPQVFMSVNGSTACNLAAVNCIPEGLILAADNCHRSVFNAAKLSGRELIRFSPEWIEKYQIPGGVAPEIIQKQFENHPDIKGVVITSPSYEGFVSDIKAIAEIVHAHDAYLIVDEAHGAHLPFCEKLPESALYLGADIVVHSLHKTVGSLNQTSLAFVNAKELADDFLEKLLMVTTTSPAYLLMASIAYAIDWAEENKAAFDSYCEKLFELRKNLTEISSNEPGVHIVDEDVIGAYGVYDLDRGKIVFCADGMDGETLYQTLYKDYRLQFEKRDELTALAMTTVWDTEEGFARLYEAVKAINETLKVK